MSESNREINSTTRKNKAIDEIVVLSLPLTLPERQEMRSQLFPIDLRYLELMGPKGMCY